MKKCKNKALILLIAILLITVPVVHAIGQGDRCNHKFRTYVAGTKQMQIYTHSERIQGVYPAQYYPCIVYRDEIVLRTECTECGLSHDEIKPNVGGPEKHHRAYGY